jgi:hypothetical protein
MSETNEMQNSTEQLTSIEGGTPEATTEEAPKSLVEGEKVEEPAPEFVPLTIEDIVLPEGFTPDEELIPEFLKVVNDQELTAKDRANALVDLQAKLMTKASEASSAAWDKTQKEWQDAVKADPVIGGEKFTQSIAQVNKLLTEYGNDKVNEAFALTGAGNNPEIIRFLHTIAGKLTEGGYTQGQPAGSPQDLASLMYPNMKG